MKYKFTGETKQFCSITLRRIQAEEDCKIVREAAA